MLLTVDGRQYRVSNPADPYPEVQVWINNRFGGHWRRFTGNGERYRQIVAIARGKA